MDNYASKGYARRYRKRKSRPAFRIGKSRPNVFSGELISKIVLLLISIAIFLPIELGFLAGRELFPHTLILILAAFPCLWVYIVRVVRAYRLTEIAPTDVTIVLYILLVSFSIYFIHGSQYVADIAYHVLETGSSYLVGRVLVRDLATFRFFMCVLVALIALSIPIALYENISGVRLINTFFHEHGLMVNDKEGKLRFEYYRSYLTFENPILFGVVCAMTTGAALHLCSMRKFYRAVTTAVVGLAVFTSISSAAILSYILQLIIMPFRQHVVRLGLLHNIGFWSVIIVSIGLVFYFIEINSFLTTISINDHNAIYRTYIYKYGLVEVANSPWIGIGYQDWYRHESMSSSIDSYWLYNAMRFGVPAFLLIAATFLFPIFLFFRNDNSKYEKAIIAYTSGLVGTVVALGTVHIWNAPYVIVIIFLSSGIFLFGSKDTDDEGDQSNKLRKVKKYKKIKKSRRSGRLEGTVQAKHVSKW